jgi:hypothetical protein
MTRGGIGNQQPAPGGDEPPQDLIGGFAERYERRYALDPGDLALVDVPETGHRALIDQRLGDRQPGADGVAQASKRLIRVEVGREQVRTKLSERWVEAFYSLLEQLDDGRIEADRDGAGHFDDEPRTRRGTAPAFTWPVPVPGPVHAEMRPDLEAVVKTDQQILAEGLDGADLLPDDALDLWNATRASRPGSRYGAPDEVRT